MREPTARFGKDLAVNAQHLLGGDLPVVALSDESPAILTHRAPQFAVVQQGHEGIGERVAKA